MIDIHTHILPELDDGSSNVDESIAMLNRLYTQGVDTVVATPHFYIDKIGLDDFLYLRRSSADKLSDSLKYIAERPGIAVAAEVQFYTELYSLENIEQLCISGTRYILVEMPFDYWTGYTYQALSQIYLDRGIIPIVAHVERYLAFNKESEVLLRLQEANALIQINSSFLTSRSTKRKALAMVKNGFVSFVASDCHNITSRPPNISEGFELVRKKLGAAGMENIKHYEVKLKEKLKVF